MKKGGILFKGGHYIREDIIEGNTVPHMKGLLVFIKMKLFFSYEVSFISVIWMVPSELSELICTQL